MNLTSCSENSIKKDTTSCKERDIKEQNLIDIVKQKTQKDSKHKNVNDIQFQEKKMYNRNEIRTKHHTFKGINLHKEFTMYERYQINNFKNTSSEICSTIVR